MAHAMEATRGQREMHAQYDGNPASGNSMHDAGPTGQSHLQEAKAAAEARGEHIFAKADHLGIQAGSAQRQIINSPRSPGSQPAGWHRVSTWR